MNSARDIAEGERRTAPTGADAGGVGVLCTFARFLRRLPCTRSKVTTLSLSSASKHRKHPGPAGTRGCRGAGCRGVEETCGIGVEAGCFPLVPEGAVACAVVERDEESGLASGRRIFVYGIHRSRTFVLAGAGTVSRSARWILPRRSASPSNGPFLSLGHSTDSEAQFDGHARTLLGLRLFLRSI